MCVIFKFIILTHQLGATLVGASDDGGPRGIQAEYYINITVTLNKGNLAEIENVYLPVKEGKGREFFIKMRNNTGKSLHY